MVNGKVPSPTMREAFDLSMVLYTEHELNASTFSARVTVSTLSDIYSGIVSAIGTLKGPLHGGANEEAWKVLERVGSPDNAERVDQGRPGPQGADHGLRPPGVQDRRSPGDDPQAILPGAWQGRSATTAGSGSPSRSSSEVTTQKHLPPNVDWPSARLYHYMGLDIDLYTPIFAMARVAGWAAHVIEQLDHNRLMRPEPATSAPPTAR